MLKIILFAYSKGITSSREIEWCCSTNIIFKALSCDTIPHFTTIANFVSRFPQEMAKIFSQIILICQEERLIGSKLYAIDGCKMSSLRSKKHQIIVDAQAFGEGQEHHTLQPMIESIKNVLQS
ncbi:transposase [Sessilibacter corallicola]|uniref:Transposase InsH N-terminal domain-containing protein n=1 Tax=Sessilibacter corallicola TaxID=2904075 RepID=A0ABQ0ADZ9_9GAMM